ncbi:MAG: hypothetical protein EZS28_020853 [Streblomastix strix]|uniref:Uncharacterized protein n=1 Tax=Streblomastix strix TaxID=222440 RepID=A0A5J4VMX6_9EUKA|nr:MAG: hypothetical protein EZS28_020853 [Streblomastix strix]
MKQEPEQAIIDKHHPTQQPDISPRKNRKSKPKHKNNFKPQPNQIIPTQSQDYLQSFIEDIEERAFQEYFWQIVEQSPPSADDVNMAEQNSSLQLLNSASSKRQQSEIPSLVQYQEHRAIHVTYELHLYQETVNENGSSQYKTPLFAK